MTIWRPDPRICVKAIGLLWRGRRLLVAEVYDDSGRLKGVRPLGGSVEFGESWQAALKREFLEELDLHVQIDGPPFVLENIYRHEGQQGHEVIFVADVSTISGPALPDAPISFREDSGVVCTARWFDLHDLDAGGPALYPSGLNHHLSGR